VRRGGHPQKQDQRKQSNHGRQGGHEGFTRWERSIALKVPYQS
jgi:hypothetical protein